MYARVVFLIFVMLVMTSDAQFGCNDVGVTFFSGKPDSPNDFTYVSGEFVKIILTFNCSENDERLRKVSLVVFLKTRLTKRVPLFRPGFMFRWHPDSHLLNSTFGILIEAVEFKQKSIQYGSAIPVSLNITAPSIDMALNGSTLEVRYDTDGRNIWKSKTIIVKCCTLDKLSRQMTSFDSHAAKKPQCFSELAVKHANGEMINGSSILQKIDLKCDSQSRWIYPDNVTFIDKKNIFDFTGENMTLRAGQAVIFICKGNTLKTTTLTIGNRTAIIKTGTAWSNVTLLPEDNQAEAKCKTTSLPKVAKLNVQFPPTVIDEHSLPYHLQKGSGGHVIIHLNSNPPLTLSSVVIELYGPQGRGERLNNFYLNQNDEEAGTRSRVVIHFTEVKESDFSQYSLSIPQQYLWSRNTTATFQIKESFLESTTESLSSTEPVVWMVVALCLILLAALRILYSKKKVRKARHEQRSLSPHVYEGNPVPPQNDEGLYCEPDAYENVRNTVAIPRQEATYANQAF